MKDHFQPGNSVHHRFDRLVGGKQHFRCDVRHGDHLLDLFAFGVENMGESGLFQSHRLNDVGDGLFPGGCAGVITGIPIVIPAPLQRELSCCSCHSMRCGFKKSQSGLRAPYKNISGAGPAAIRTQRTVHLRKRNCFRRCNIPSQKNRSDLGKMNHLQDIVNKNPGRIHPTCHGKAQIPRTAPEWKKSGGDLTGAVFWRLQPEGYNLPWQ